MRFYNSLRRIHKTRYKVRGEKDEREAKFDIFLASEASALCGHQFGNHDCPGYLTSNQNVRLHSCEAGTKCTVVDSANVVRITPIITRSNDGTDIPEIGAGGGGGDLNTIHELDMADGDMVNELLELCFRETDDPAKKEQVEGMIKRAIHDPAKKMSLAGLDATLLDHDISLNDFARLLLRAANQVGSRMQSPVVNEESTARPELPRTIVRRSPRSQPRR